MRDTRYRVSRKWAYREVWFTRAKFSIFNSLIVEKVENRRIWTERRLLKTWYYLFDLGFYKENGCSKSIFPHVNKGFSGVPVISFQQIQPHSVSCFQVFNMFRTNCWKLPKTPFHLFQFFQLIVENSFEGYCFPSWYTIHVYSCFENTESEPEQ